jgi:hypothetical protein
MACHRIHSPAISAAETSVYSATERSQYAFIDVSEHHPLSLERPVSPPECPIIREFATSAANLNSTNVTDNKSTPLVTPLTPTFRQPHEQDQGRTQCLNLTEVNLQHLLFMVNKNSNVDVRMLAYASLIFDRVKEKLPRIVQGTLCRERFLYFVLILA